MNSAVSRKKESVTTMIKGISGCCRGCTERYEACHDYCEKYLTAQKNWNEYKRKVKEAKKPTEYDEHKFESIRAMERRRRNARKG